MLKKLSDNAVSICCTGQGCPVVTKINDKQYEVTDDDGNKVILSKAELLLIKDAVNMVTENAEDNRELLFG